MSDERDFRNLQPVPKFTRRRIYIERAIRLALVIGISAFAGYQFGALRTRFACIAVLNEVAGELSSIRSMGGK